MWSLDQHTDLKESTKASALIRMKTKKQKQEYHWENPTGKYQDSLNNTQNIKVELRKPDGKILKPQPLTNIDQTITNLFAAFANTSFITQTTKKVLLQQTDWHIFTLLLLQLNPSFHLKFYQL